MAYTETTTRSYGSRLGGSLKGIFTGIILFLAATALLWWNEGRAVKQSDAIKDAEKSYVSMDDPSKIDPALDGELVYACALATTKDSIEDSDFGVKANALNMTRKVEYYQWQEEARSESKDKLGGSEETTTTYTYKVGWSSDPINSNDFKDPQYKGKNTVLANVEKGSWVAPDVTFGAYTLPETIVKSLSANEKLPVKMSEAKLNELEKNLNPNAKSLAKQTLDMVAAAQQDTSMVVKDSVQAPKMELETEYVHVGDNQIYLGKNPAAPQIGDVRITYFICSPTKASIIAKVKGNTFTKYTASNKNTILLVEKGVVDSEEMIQNAKDANSMWTWVLRIIGLILLYAAFHAMLGFPEMLAKVVPFISSIIGIGTSIICVLLTIIWGGLIIAIAWFFYRPILSIIILAVVAAAGFAIWKYKKSKGGAAPAQPQA